jgi:hypothetical protein
MGSRWGGYALPSSPQRGEKGANSFLNSFGTGNGLSNLRPQQLAVAVAQAENGHLYCPFAAAQKAGDFCIRDQLENNLALLSSRGKKPVLTNRATLARGSRGN